MARQGTIKGSRLQRVSTVEALTVALSEQILDGSLPAGTPLPEAELCETFGVSRHSVRTALQALRHEGLVKHEVNRGTFVNKPTVEDIRTLFNLREILEVSALEALVEHPDRLAGPREAVARLDRLADEGASWTEMRDADLAFHAALVGALRNPRIDRIHSGMLTELRLCFLHFRDQLGIGEDVVREHSEVLEAIEDGSGEEAIRLLREHLRDATEKIIDAYEPE
jgi:DNA-binding GntR family transcriptional regulator